MPIQFTPEAVRALCGGEFPYGGGFNGDRVEYFLLEEGYLQPYAGGTILPGPAIKVTTEVYKPMMSFSAS